MSKTLDTSSKERPKSAKKKTLRKDPIADLRECMQTTMRFDNNDRDGSPENQETICTKVKELNLSFEDFLAIRKEAKEIQENEFTYTSNS